MDARLSAEAVRAAERLRHDVGKSVRLSAPDVLEADTEALRARLRADVLETRRDRSGSTAAATLFDAWRQEQGGLFQAGALADRLAELGRAIDQVRRLAARLDALDRPGLERLDGLTREVAERCRELSAAAKAARP